MHARNPFHAQIEYPALAAKYPKFAEWLGKRVRQCVCGPHKNSARACNRSHEQLLHACSCVTNDDGNMQFDWSRGLPTLSETLLLDKFALACTFPPDRLCPPVPNRLNYILHLEDLVSSWLPSQTTPESVPMIGIDVGTGASAIFPLLGELRSIDS